MKATAAPSAGGLLQACDLFLELNSRMPLRCVQTFLAVAMRPGQSVDDYARQCRLSASTMSRNLLDIGERNRNMDEGYGLIVGRDNPNNRRERSFTSRRSARRCSTRCWPRSSRR